MAALMCYNWQRLLTVGVCGKPAFVWAGKPAPSFCQQLRGLIRCTERADDALVSGGVNKKMNSTCNTASLYLQNGVTGPEPTALKVWPFMSSRPQYWWRLWLGVGPALRPFRGSHAANKGIDWLLGQSSHKGTEHSSFEKPNGLATQPVPL